MDMSIENTTLAHFRHFSPLYTNLPSTPVENIRQISFFMQNKPNFPCFSTKNDDFTKKQTQYKPNTNPIKANFGQKIRGAKPNKANSNPNFILDIGLLALEFTLGCAYLLFCRGSGTNPIHPSIRVPATLMIDDRLHPAYNDNDNF